MSSSNQPPPSFAIAALKELGAEADFSSRLFVWTPPAYGLFLFGRSWSETNTSTASCWFCCVGEPPGYFVPV